MRKEIMVGGAEEWDITGDKLSKFISGDEGFLSEVRSASEMLTPAAAENLDDVLNTLWTGVEKECQKECTLGGEVKDFLGGAPGLGAKSPIKQKKQKDPFKGLFNAQTKALGLGKTRSAPAAQKTQVEQAVLQQAAQEAAAQEAQRPKKKVWDYKLHGAMIPTWHKILKSSFKTIIGLTLTTPSVSAGVAAVTVGQLFGTIDKVLITLIAVGLSSLCAGLNTWTGTAVGATTLYTIITSMYRNVAGQTQQQNIANVAGLCYSADDNLRGHVTSTANEFSGLLTRPTLIDIIKKANGTLDNLSSALAGLFMSILIKKLYDPPTPQQLQPQPLPQIPQGEIPYYPAAALRRTPTENNPWVFALVKRRTQGDPSVPSYIPLFDIWGCISIPAIYEEAEVPDEYEGRVQVQSSIEFIYNILQIPGLIMNGMDNESEIDAEQETTVMDSDPGQDLNSPYAHWSAPGNAAQPNAPPNEAEDMDL